MKRSTFFQFAAPSIVIMTLLMVIPLLMAIWLGMQFMTFNNINDPQFIGLDNYIDVLGDPRLCPLRAKPHLQGGYHYDL